MTNSRPRVTGADAAGAGVGSFLGIHVIAKRFHEV
jgi:hypothetical protein